MCISIHFFPQAKIADFGLLREMDSSSSQMNMTAVVGTPGYMDPAYVQSQYATPSVDVYRCVRWQHFSCVMLTDGSMLIPILVAAEEGCIMALVRDVILDVLLELLPFACAIISDGGYANIYHSE